jgi:hypothetical protein
MIKLNINRFSIIVSIVALLVGFALVAHHAMGSTCAQTFCLFNLCVFIPAFFTMPQLFGRLFALHSYRSSRGNEIPFRVERPPRS